MIIKANLDGSALIKLESIDETAQFLNWKQIVTQLSLPEQSDELRIRFQQV